MTSTDTPRGRHRLAEPVRRPALLPRSLSVVAATVGTVLAFGAQQRVDVPAPRPHSDAPTRVMAALQPVVPAPRADRPSSFDRVTGGVTGRAIAGAHGSGSAVHAVAARNLFTA